jgi:hypothetical protein
MRPLLTAIFMTIASVAAITCALAVAPSIARADEPRFDFSSRKTAEASYARVFAQFSPAGSRAFERDVKKLVIVQFSTDGTVSGGRAAIKRRKPTAAQYYAAMTKALNGKTAAEVVALAERLKD